MNKAWNPFARDRGKQNIWAAGAGGQSTAAPTRLAPTISRKASGQEATLALPCRIAGTLSIALISLLLFSTLDRSLLVPRDSPNTSNLLTFQPSNLLTFQPSNLLTF